MRRLLLRILLHLATTLSLCCCVAAAVFWVRSHHAGEQTYASRWRVNGNHIEESAWWLMSDVGRIGVAFRFQELPADANTVRQLQSLIANPDYSRRAVPPGDLLGSSRQFGPFPRLGFTYIDDTPMKPGTIGGYRQWTVPFWFVCLVTAALPAWRLHRLLRRRRPLPGHCVKCGYDIRATPYRCPECGSRIRGTAPLNKGDSPP